MNWDRKNLKRCNLTRPKMRLKDLTIFKYLLLKLIINTELAIFLRLIFPNETELNHFLKLEFQIRLDRDMDPLSTPASGEP
jgi:hypothetical protein